MVKVRIKQLPRRQRIRTALLLVSFFLFPITLYYFSPMLILQAASEGVVNGSMLVFGLQFLSALVVGRLWCGWACPTGALQDVAHSVNNQRSPRFLNHIKWAIWIPWIGLIVGLAVSAGGLRTINPLYQLETGATLALPLDGGGPPWFMIYYVVVFLMFALVAVAGRRAACHSICWMAPFMIIGRWMRNRVRWPSLRLDGNAQTCTSCMTCTSTCPMSIDVHALVQRGDMEHGECNLCGVCVDNCPVDAIRYTFRRG